MPDMVAANGAGKTPETYAFPDADPREKSTVVRYGYGTGASEVVLYEMRNGGHTEPSLQEHYGFLCKCIAGNQHRDIEMADEVWRFFKGKLRPAAVGP